MDKRRLQADIDRTIKKVTEGRQVFQETLCKFEQAASQIQKEKFEADLKKEIKKLQRFRDQIKTWLTSNEIKDKKGLSDARKEIEMDMERFKVIERETKTKAYSKEGLGLEVKKDPLQKEKEEWEEWFKHIIAELNMAAEKIEFDIETTQSAMKKKRNEREKLADSKRSKLEEVRSHIVWCEVCMRALDNDNLDLTRLKSYKEDIEYYCSQPCDYELELNTYNELIIDQGKLVEETFNLSNRELSHSNSDISSIGDREVVSRELDESKSSSGAKNHSLDNSRQRHKSLDEKPSLQMETALKSSNHLSSSKSGHTSSNRNQIAAVTQNPIISVTAPFLLAASFVEPLLSASANNFVANAHSKNKGDSLPLVIEKKDNSFILSTHTDSLLSSKLPIESNMTQTNGTIHGKDSVCSNGFNFQEISVLPTSSHVPFSNSSGEVFNTANSSYADKVCDSLKQTQSENSSNSVMLLDDSMPPLDKVSENSTVFHSDELSNIIQRNLTLEPTSGSMEKSAAISNISLNSNFSRQTSFSVSNSSQIKDSASPLLSYPLSGLPVQQSFFRLSSTSTALPHDRDRYSNRMTGFDSPLPYPTVIHNENFPITGSGMTLGRPIARLFPPPPSTLTSLSFQNTDIFAPFRNKSISTEQMATATNLLELGHRRFTRPQDSSRARLTLLKIPPSYETQYPKEVCDYCCTEEYYSRLDPSTLFFIFYYFEGSKAQYLASKALKKKSWRFHKQDLLWFQRLEEPKQIDEDSECGTYIYWDPETKSQKKRDNFTFEYRFLEDTELT